jgi:hypothetical protein
MQIPCGILSLRRLAQTAGFVRVRAANIAPFPHQVQHSFKAMTPEGLIRRYYTRLG